MPSSAIPSRDLLHLHSASAVLLAPSRLGPAIVYRGGLSRYVRVDDQSRRHASAHLPHRLVLIIRPIEVYIGLLTATHGESTIAVWTACTSAALWPSRAPAKRRHAHAATSTVQIDRPGTQLCQ